MGDATALGLVVQEAVVTQSTHCRSVRLGRRALAVYLAAAGAVALVSTISWWLHGHGYEWRARGLSHHHMTYGGQLLLELPVALAVALTARDARWRVGAASVALLIAIGLATTFTRSAWVGAFVSGLVVVGGVWPWGLALLAVALPAVTGVKRRLNELLGQEGN